MDLVEALASGIGPRTAGSEAAARAAETVADAFRELGLDARFEEFQLLGYEADEPKLEVEGERWDAGPCMYAHDFDGEGTVRRIGASTPPTAFVSRSDAQRLVDGMHVRLKVSGRFLPGRTERNVIADLPGRGDQHVVVGAHYDSVWRGPGAID